MFLSSQEWNEDVDLGLTNLSIVPSPHIDNFVSHQFVLQADWTLDPYAN
jgi:hypothetical protein